MALRGRRGARAVAGRAARRRILRLHPRDQLLDQNLPEKTLV
jgi:hypothetical protein